MNQTFLITISVNIILFFTSSCSGSMCRSERSLICLKDKKLLKKGRRLVQMIMHSTYFTDEMNYANSTTFL
jgi:hypothetical protein